MALSTASMFGPPVELSPVARLAWQAVRAVHVPEVAAALGGLIEALAVAGDAGLEAAVVRNAHQRLAVGLLDALGVLEGVDKVWVSSAGTVAAVGERRLRLTAAARAELKGELPC